MKRTRKTRAVRRVSPSPVSRLEAPSGAFFRCLCVKPPYAGHIVAGKKLEEYRSQPTRIRGRIGIIESGSGTIIGEAELYDCTERGDWDFVWHLRNAKRYDAPRPYVHPFGAVVWVRVPLK